MFCEYIPQIATSKFSKKIIYLIKLLELNIHEDFNSY